MKNNRTISLIAVLAMVAMSALIAVPVSADQVLVKTPNGGVTPSFSFAVNGSPTVTFPLTVVGQNDLTTTNFVNVQSNAPYSVSASDGPLAGGAPPASAGHMKSSDGSNPYTGYYLTNPLQVATNGDPYVSLSGTNQALHTKTLTGESFSHELKLRQVTTYNDGVLPGNSFYGMYVVVTAAVS